MEKVTINGIDYPIKLIYSSNRSANSRLREGEIRISIPNNWSNIEKNKTFDSLLKRSIKSISNGKWTIEGSKRISFFDSQILKTIGGEFILVFNEYGKNGFVFFDNEMINVTHLNSEKRDLIIRKVLVQKLMPIISLRTDHYEKILEVEKIKIRIKDSLTIWGSFSNRNKSMTLNFRLLFMPLEILDYVILHELCHSKYRGHGVRFWNLVESIMPNYKEKRKWLKENGWSVLSHKQVI